MARWKVVRLRGFPRLESLAEAYGAIRAAVEREGQPIEAMDMLIAAHAVSLGVVLVTNNARAFARVPGLGVENWARD